MYTYINVLPHMSLIVTAELTGWLIAFIAYPNAFRCIIKWRLLLSVIKRFIYILPIVAVTPDTSIDWIVPYMFSGYGFVYPLVVVRTLSESPHNTHELMHRSFFIYTTGLISGLYYVMVDNLINLPLSTTLPYMLFILGLTLSIASVTLRGLTRRTINYISI